MSKLTHHTSMLWPVQGKEIWTVWIFKYVLYWLKMQKWRWILRPYIKKKVGSWYPFPLWVVQFEMLYFHLYLPRYTNSDGSTIVLLLWHDISSSTFPLWVFWLLGWGCLFCFAVGLVFLIIIFVVVLHKVWTSNMDNSLNYTNYIKIESLIIVCLCIAK